jgi:hypothetical protein
MKRRHFLAATAGLTAAACTSRCPKPSPVVPGLEMLGNFPFNALKGQSGFAMTMEGLCAFVLPKGGLETANRLDALLVKGDQGHEHVPSLFVPRPAWRRTAVTGVTMAQPVSLDPHHAVFSLEGMHVKLVQQVAPEPYADPQQPNLTFNKEPVNIVKCADRNAGTFPGFRWLLDFATEWANPNQAVKIDKDWRTKTALYQTRIELLTGRIEHAEDIKSVGTGGAGHVWNLAKGDPRYLKEVLHHGMPDKKYTHIQLKPLNGGDATSVIVDSYEYFAPVGVLHAAAKYVNPDDVKVGYEADDLKCLAGLVPNVTFTIPTINALKACNVGRTPECGCCPPGFIEDTN